MPLLFLADLMLQHGLIEGQLDVQDLVERDLAVASDAVRALEGEAAGAADVVKGTGQVEGVRVLAALGT